MDLIEHPAIDSLTREKVQTRLKAGMAQQVAAGWIDELERAAGTASSTEPERLLQREARGAENEARAAAVGL